MMQKGAALRSKNTIPGYMTLGLVLWFLAPQHIWSKIFAAAS
jgi:hypothetical protein